MPFVCDLEVKAIRIEQEIKQPHREDAVIIHVWFHHLVHNDNLLEAVTDKAQGALLLLALLVRVQAQGGLDVVAAAASRKVV